MTGEGKEVAETSWSGKWYQATWSVGSSLGIFSGKFMIPLTSYKSLQSLKDGLRTQEMQNPFTPRSCSPENPQHLAHVGSQERYGLPWQLSLLRDGAAGFMSHRENTLPGFAKDFVPKWKNLHTHHTKWERDFWASSCGIKMFDLIRSGQSQDCWKEHCLLFAFSPSKWKVMP